MNGAGLQVWNPAEPPDRDLPEWNPPAGPIGVDPHAGRPAVSSAWEGSPVPLGARRLLPMFPVDALPSWVGDCVAAVAEATQTPVDLAGCVALACLSTAAGGKAVVIPRDGWSEQVNIYTVTALPPGSRKSAVFRAMTRPLMEAEKALADVAGPARVEAEVALRVARRRPRTRRRRQSRHRSNTSWRRPLPRPTQPSRQTASVCP